MVPNCYYFFKKFFFFFITIAIFLANFSIAQTASLDATLSLKEINGIKIPFQNGFALPSFEKQNRPILDLKGEWKKLRFTANDEITLAKRDSAGYQNLIDEAQGRNSSTFDDSGWESKTLPSVENQMNEYPSVPEFYQEGVWYRKSFAVDSANSGMFVKLMFYAVNYVADVWLNDVYLGYHEGGYTPFAFDVSSILNYNGNNVLVVRIDNPIWGYRNDIVPYTSCDWFNYTGLIHDVYLEFATPVSIIRNDIVPLDLDGNIKSTVVIKNINPGSMNVDNVTIQVYKASIDSSNIETEFSYQLAGEEVPINFLTQNTISILTDSTSVLRTVLKIDNPDLWTPRIPNLYIMKVSLKNGSDVIDEFTSQFGVRTLSISGNKFLLNNKVVFLTGTARHEDHPVYGRSIPKDIIFNDLKMVKNLNVNFLRTAHYPNNLYTYLIADRLGISTLEEIPVWWFDTAEAWQIQNNDRHIHEQMFREMVFKDYNRPSVILWSTSNECLDVDNRKIFIARVNQDLDTNYPDGRLVTESAAADRPGAYDDSQAACDVAGWTMYFGIFHGSTYFTGTYNFINEVKTYYPNKPVLDTEFGYWSSENGTSEQEQVDVFNNTFTAFKQHAALTSIGTVNSNGPLMACTWWCIFDWYTNQSRGGYQSMGLYSMDRTVAKTVASVLKTAYLPYYNFDGVITDVDEKAKDDLLPEKFELSQNYPNPFNPSTIIKYSIPNLNNNIFDVSLKVFDVLGNEIATLVNEKQSSGNYEVEFNSSSNIKTASGVYFYQLKVSNFIKTKKMILIK